MFSSKELKAFIATAEEGSLKKAADRLFLTIPPVCRMIKKLESQLGMKLFLNTAAGLKLTPQGKEVYNEISPVYYQSIKVIKDMLQDRETIFLALNNPHWTTSNIISDFFVRNEVRFSCLEGNDIKPDYCDIFITDKIDNISECYHCEVINEHFCIVCIPSVLDKIKSLPFAQIKSFLSTDICSNQLTYLEKKGFSKKTIECLNFDNNLNMLISGHAASIMSRYRANQYQELVGNKITIIDEIPTTRPLYILINKKSRLINDSVFREYIVKIKNMMDRC
ncbi:LysR family transcriptional regulator [Yersinia enterocolitica]